MGKESDLPIPRKPKQHWVVTKLLN